MIEQGPTAEVLGLKDALLLGIEDILKKDTPEKLDLFFQEKDQSMHLSDDLIKKLQGTLGVVWTKNPPDEPLGNWAINLFLAHYAVDDLLGDENGGVKSPFLPFKGYTLVSEKKAGDPRLCISAELTHQEDKMP